MSSEPASRREIFDERVAGVFRRAGWKVRRLPPGGREAGGDLIVRQKGQSYLVEIKGVAEGRRDRLIPILAVAILQVQAFARQSHEPVAPLAVVGAVHVGESLVHEVERFVRDYAPDVAVGIVDLEGFQWFRGPGLESLSASRGRAEQRMRVRASEPPVANLFSDLNQWMLKVLLAPHIRPELLNAPRGEYRNASELAEAAGVSVMSAFRFVRQLRSEGFVGDSRSVLEIVRIEQLLRRWQAMYLAPVREVPMRWVLRGSPDRQLHDAVRRWVSRPAAESSARPRICLGLFAASDALGVGFVRGVSPHLYVEALDPKALQDLGLSLEAPAGAPDVLVRVPSARESIFRGTVERNGAPVSDAIQVWLDASGYLSRGKEQADVIYRRVLQPLVGKSRS